MEAVEALSAPLRPPDGLRGRVVKPWQGCMRCALKKPARRSAYFVTPWTKTPKSPSSIYVLDTGTELLPLASKLYQEEAAPA